jgi:predicted permease
VCILIGFKPQGVFFDTISKVGDTTKYITLIYIGGTLAGISLKNIPSRYPIFISVVLKMIAAPVVVYLILTNFFSSILAPTAIAVLTIYTSLPSMSTIAMLSRSYHSDYKYASEFVFITTSLSIVTIPFVAWIVSRL